MAHAIISDDKQNKLNIRKHGNFTVIFHQKYVFSRFLAFRVFQEETVSLCSGQVTLLFCHSCEHWFHPWNLYNLNWFVYICL